MNQDIMEVLGQEDLGLSAEQQLAIIRALSSAESMDDDGYADMDDGDKMGDYDKRSAESTDDEMDNDKMERDTLSSMKRQMDSMNAAVRKLSAALDTANASKSTQQAASKGQGDTTMDEVKKLIADALKTAPSTDTVPGYSAPDGGANKSGRVQVLNKYRDLDVHDAAFLRLARVAHANHTQTAYDNPELDGYLVEAAQKGIKSGELKLDDDVSGRILGIKSNELNNTVLAGAGGNWTTTLMSEDIWRRTRVDNNIMSSFRQIEMPSNSFDLPVESTDPVVYKIPETTDDSQLSLTASDTPIPSGRLTAEKKTLVATKLAVRTGFSTEIQEDSVIPLIPQLRSQQLRSMQDAIDNSGANGDTSTGSGNINKKGGTVAATDTNVYLTYNGLRRLALVTNTSLAVDAGGLSPTLAKLREARAKLLQYSIRPDGLVIFADLYTWNKMLNIDEFVNQQINGEMSTARTGTLPTVDGIPVYPSNELGLTDTDGYISTTAASNTRGQIVMAHRNSWIMGYRRQITSSVVFRPEYDSYQMIHTARVAFINQDNNCVAMLYNVGV